MKGDRFEFEFIVDVKDNKVPKVGFVQNIVSKNSEGERIEKKYQIDKYTSSEIIDDGKKISVWLEATEI